MALSNTRRCICLLVVAALLVAGCSSSSTSKARVDHHRSLPTVSRSASIADRLRGILPGPAPASVGQEPGETVAFCWPVLCTGTDHSNMFYQFGPVYAYLSGGKQAYRIANFHLWFTGDGNGNVDFYNTALFDQAGNSSLNSDVTDPNNPACLLRGLSENANANGSTYNVVNHAILSFPEDMCFVFAGPGLVNVTTLQVVGTVSLTKATSKVPPSRAGDERLSAAQGKQVVVMGDSYASGEGTYNKNGPNADPPSVDYIDNTKVDPTGKSGCHRSPAAYAPLMGVPEGNFVACSGSTISDVVQGSKGFKSQLKALTSNTKVVILSITGNDLGFGGVLDACTSIPPTHLRSDAKCSNVISTSVAGIDQAMTDLASLWSQIETMTGSQVKIIQVGYPHFFPATPYALGCNGVSVASQGNLNSVVDKVDYALFNAANSDPHVTFVDMKPVFADHPVCGVPVKYINDLQLNIPGRQNCPPNYLVGPGCSQSYHPTTTAYAAERAVLWPLVKQALGTG